MSDYKVKDIALADFGKLQAATAAADDPHVRSWETLSPDWREGVGGQSFNKGFRSGAVSITSGAGDLPISISRLPTI